MAQPSRTATATFAWATTLLMAGFCAVAGVVLGVAAFSMAWNRPSSSGDVGAGLILVFSLVTSIAAAVSVVVCQRSSSALTLARFSPGGAVLGVVLCLAVEAVLTLSSRAPTWVDEPVMLLVAPLALWLGAWAGTFVPVRWPADALLVGFATAVITSATSTFIAYAPDPPPPAKVQGTRPAPAAGRVATDARLIGVVDGMAVVAAESGFRAIRNGAVVWSQSVVTNRPNRTGPGLVTSDGITYAVAGGELVAFSAVGEPLWTLDAIPAEYHAVVAHDRAGRLYSALTDGRDRVLEQLDLTTRRPLWRRRIGPIGQFPLVVALARDGSVVVEAEQDVIAFSVDGAERWRRSRPGGRVAVDGDGVVYIAGNRDIEVVEASGTTRRVLDVPEGLWGHAPSVGPDGTIYVAARGLAARGLAALDPHGELRWRWQPEEGRSMATPPVVLATGDILVGIDDGTVAAVSSAGVLRWRWTPDSEWPSPASRLVATPIGTFVQISSHLYLLTTAGPSASAWPQAGGCTGVTGQACDATEGAR